MGKQAYRTRHTRGFQLISVKIIDFSGSKNKPSEKVELRPEAFGLPAIDSVARPVSVAVIDTGCPSHSAINRVNVESSINRTDFVSDERIPWDGNGHSTAISGLISGSSEYFSGIFPQSLMHYARVIDKDGRTSTKRISAGLLWSAARQVDVAVIAAGCAENDRYLQEVVAKCIQRGMMIVAAAKSNEGSRSIKVYPGNSPGVIGCYFSKKLNINMRENGGLDVGIPYRSIWTLAPDDRYIKLGGSSVATGIVAGSIAGYFASGKSKDDIFNMLKDISSCH
jgi:subtilisin